MAKKRRKQRRASQKQQNSSDLKPINNPENVLETIINKNGQNISEKVPKNLFAAPAPVGLSNLGNTCFFNSIMQNLIQTPLLHQLLKQEIQSSNSQSIVVDPNDGETPALEYTPTSLGEISVALSSFFDSVKNTQEASYGNRNLRKQSRDRILSPKNLFGKICSKNERFRGFQQQDSQEFYHCLLDSIRNEEIKRKKKGILKALGLNKQSTSDVPDELRKRLKVYGRQLLEEEDTLVEKVFGGRLVSSVLCDSCGSVTAVNEPFYDVSLPIPDLKPERKTLISKNSDDSDPSEQATEENKKPLSKHALKKKKKKEEKEMRRKRKQLKFKPDEQGESVDSLAGSMAMKVIELAMMSMSLTPSLKETEFSNVDEAPVDYMKLNGGAENLNFTDLNLSVVEVERFDPDDDVKAERNDDIKYLELNSTSEKESENNDTSFCKDDTFLDSPQPSEPVYTPVQLCHFHLPASLKPRETVETRNCSIQSCFYQFTMPEILTGPNKFGCETCTKRQNDDAAGEAKTVYCNASKQILIKSPPRILTIHLKRFQQARCRLQKVNKSVLIPPVLDIAPFCISTCQEYADEERGIQYSLYGLVEHTGSLTRGHYTAYVRTRSVESDADPKSGTWYHISDSRVLKVTSSKALNSNAYILFYERIQSPVS